jgi:hypothetical protein
VLRDETPFPSEVQAVRLACCSWQTCIFKTLKRM